MSDIERQIEELTRQVQELRSRQMQMNNELVLTERRLQSLQAAIFEDSHELEEEAVIAPQPVEPPAKVPYILQAQQNVQVKRTAPQKKAFQVNHELEDFIGTNVISKVGILITIIGVFIGAKYAIDNELISPLMRILAGYLSAGILIFIAFRLKKKYEYFSSILIGGGLAVTYFITYIAYSFYALFPLGVAFAIMVITTIAAVAIALWYNQKIIAIIGQVAAYAIPFLLGDGHGNIFILFSYITVINFGLLILSFKKDWKLLYHIAFFLTWLIYLFSIVVAEKVTGNFSAGLTFIAINFFTFYVTFLSYKIYKKELYQVGEIGVLLFNALFFFFIGTYLVNQEFKNVHLLTWFTVANAGIHLAAGFLIYRLRLVDNSVFQFILGLALLFITVAIPIELDGNWVTALWTIEATALFYVAKNSGRDLYLDLALSLVIISLISLLQDWEENYPFIRRAILSDHGLYRTPFVNINFALSVFICGCLGYMSFAVAKFTTISRSITRGFFTKILPVVFIAIFYFTLYNEIHFAWDENTNNSDLRTYPLYRLITLIIYSCLYISGWMLINSKLIKRADLHQLLLVLVLFSDATFLFNGLVAVGELRDYYIDHATTASKTLLLVRYFSIAGIAILWLSVWIALKQFQPSKSLQKIISTVFNITLLSIVSNEFIHWMDLAGYQNQYKLGLSLICGSYAFILLFTGILKKKKHLRISAIVLFGSTLLKLFFYDLASLSTISKTIVLVLLGILLLLASFLYNKYKDLLFANEEPRE